MSTKDLINAYYSSLNKKTNTWQEMWAENGTFSDASNIIHAQGKDAVIQSFTPFVNEQIKSVQVKEIIGEKNKLCAIVSYTYINPKKETMQQNVAEVWEVNEEKLVKLTLYFDLTAYRSFITRA